jgi:hypothetical protein
MAGFAVWACGLICVAMIVSGATTRNGAAARRIAAIAAYLVAVVLAQLVFTDSGLASPFVSERASGGVSYTLLGFVTPTLLLFPVFFVALIISEHRILLRVLGDPLTPLDTEDPELEAEIERLVAAGFEVSGQVFDVARASLAVLAHPSGTRLETARGPSQAPKVRCEAVTRFTDGTRLCSSNQLEGLPRSVHRMPDAQPLELFAAHRELVEERIAAGAVVLDDLSIDAWVQDARQEMEALLERPWRSAALIAAQFVAGLRSWALSSDRST